MAQPANRWERSGEDRLLGRILEALPEVGPAPDLARPRVVLGPGDDAAAIRWTDGGTLLLTTDAAEEGTHFDRFLHPLSAVGRRAVAAAVSDVAAMGGRPVATLISLVASPQDEAAAVEIEAAAAQRALELDAPVVGGNITAGQRLGLHVTVAGATAPGVPVLRRSGALPGDGLFVTGQLGGAALGLEVLRRRAGGDSAPPDPEDARFVARQLDPTPRLDAGAALAGAAHAGMDISDGLALDLHRLAAASRVGALVETNRLPLAAAGARGLEAALFGGEDYELLVAGPDHRVLAASGAASVPLVRIGRMTSAAEGIRLRSAAGLIETLQPRGWDSFAGGAAS